MWIPDTAKQTLSSKNYTSLKTQNRQANMPIKVEIWDARKKSLFFNFSLLICELALEHIQLIVT